MSGRFSPLTRSRSTPLPLRRIFFKSRSYTWREGRGREGKGGNNVERDGGNGREGEWKGGEGKRRGGEGEILVAPSYQILWLNSDSVAVVRMLNTLYDVSMNMSRSSTNIWQYLGNEARYTSRNTNRKSNIVDQILSLQMTLLTFKGHFDYWIPGPRPLPRKIQPIYLFYYENRTSCTHRGKKKKKKTNKQTNEQTNKHKPKTHTMCQ